MAAAVKTRRFLKDSIDILTMVNRMRLSIVAQDMQDISNAIFITLLLYQPSVGTIK